MAQMQTNLPPQPPLLRIEPFKGINLSVTPTQIDQHQSPDMLNMTIDERGALNKRTGYEKVFPNNLGAGMINGMFLYRKKDNTEKFIFAHSTKLYTQSGSGDPVEIYSGLANNQVIFFVMNDLCYIMDGATYLVYNGITVSPVTPYIPTLAISKTPTGGGTSFEDFNLLGAGFKDSFSADGTATVYQLSLKSLDATSVTAVVNGANMAEGSGLTVDRANGKVTFSVAPAVGTNNVVITAYKTFSGFADRIKNCDMAVIFGGDNDSRVFVSSNHNFPNYIWRSGLYDPTYFPENGFYKVGSDPERIQGFSKQYDYLVIEKEYSKWVMRYQLNEGVPTFPINPINDKVGAVARNSIQVIDNNPISLDKTGVYLLTASNVRDERNVQHISSNVDNQLLKEENLRLATSIDYDRKYWLAINKRVYIFDYSINEWYIFDNIDASCFLEMNGSLYFGSAGMVYRFKKENESLPYNDDGVAINAYWKSKHMTFGFDERRKLVEKVFFSMKPAAKTSADLSYISDKKISAVVKSKRMDTFDFNSIDFNNFTFTLSSFPQEVMAKIKAKKITQFQLILENKELDESLGILSIGIKWRPQSEVK